MKMRSHIFSAVAMSCVLKTTVVPRRRISRTASLSASALTGSRPEKGSSRIRSAGLVMTEATNWTFCDMPFERASIFFSPQPCMPMRAIQSSMDGIELGDRPALQLPVVAEQAAHGHLLIEAALLGQVADAIAGGRGVAGAEDFDLPLVRQQDVHDHPERRRLAGAVGADESVDRAFGDGEREAVDGGDAAEALGDVGQSNRVGHKVGSGAPPFYAPGRIDNFVKLFTL